MLLFISIIIAMLTFLRKCIFITIIITFIPLVATITRIENVEEPNIIACISRYMNTVPDDKCTTNKTSQFSKFCLFRFSIAM